MMTSAKRAPFTEQLAAAQSAHHSLLCVGLDPDPARFPPHLVHASSADAILAFCTAIVEATADLACAFKPQIAYFAAHRAEAQLERLIQHIRRVAPQVPVVLDAKRGDIGSTAEQYARECFERYDADAVTLSPFMGFDSVEPYLRYPGRGAFLLCRTSNPGGDDLQARVLHDVPPLNGAPPRLFEQVAAWAQGPWNVNGQLGLVVGATRPSEIDAVRRVAPTLPLLIPGVGAQGGDAVATVRAGLVDQTGLHGTILVNSSRAILYADQGPDFAAAARDAARRTRDELNAARADR
jgi:orotidine-5'-phosphate decarboxylase